MYNYSFRNSMWNMHRNKNKALNRIKMKLAVFAGSNLKLLDMEYEECYVGWQNSLSGMPHINPSVYYRNRNLRGVDPWKCHCPCSQMAELLINSSGTQHLINALTSAVWHCSDQPVTSCHRGHDTVSFSAYFKLPIAFHMIIHYKWMCTQKFLSSCTPWGCSGRK